MAVYRVNDPPAPQSAVVTTAVTGAAPYLNAYTDPALTSRNPPHQDLVPTPPKSGSTTLGGVTVYDVAGTQKDGFTPTDPPPHSPNSWQPGRDPYKQNGTDPYLQNQG